MGKRMARSARGEIVDFDLIAIKQSIASAPKPVVVEQRETYVDIQAGKRLRRSIKPKIKPTTEVSPLPSEPVKDESK